MSGTVAQHERSDSPQQEHLLTATVTHPIDWLLAAPTRRETIGTHTLAVFGSDPAAANGCLLSGPAAQAGSSRRRLELRVADEIAAFAESL